MDRLPRVRALFSVTFLYVDKVYIIGSNWLCWKESLYHKYFYFAVFTHPNMFFICFTKLFSMTWHGNASARIRVSWIYAIIVTS